MRKLFADFIFAVLAGACIAIGGAVFVATESKLAGAILFTVGLFTICASGFNLYTGKIGYLLDNKPKYLIFLVIVWLGNLCGAAGVGYLLRASRFLNSAVEKCTALCNTKLNDGLLSIFIMSFFCGILVFISVDGFKRFGGIGKYVALFMGVTVFIMCGFEHCIANMFYFSFANMWSWKTLGYVAMMTAGNSVGGLLIPALTKAYKAINVSD